MRATRLSHGSMEDYLIQIKSIIGSLTPIDDPLPAPHHINVILEGLPQYFSLVMSLIESKFELV